MFLSIFGHFRDFEGFFGVCFNYFGGSKGVGPKDLGALAHFE